MNFAASNKDPWPYTTLIPHSLKVYPVVQFAPRIGPQKPENWPPQFNSRVLRWKESLNESSHEHNLIYVHIPFCPFLCSFCPLFKVEDSRGRTDFAKELYVEDLVKEIELYGRISNVAEGYFDAIYIGGGTPTELKPGQLKRILIAIKNNFNVAKDCEITLEGVANQMLAPDYLAKCFAIGFNRISFGVQSFDEKLRKSIGRGDNVEDIYALIEFAKKIAPNYPVNVDILAGLPGQSFEVLKADIQKVIDLKLDSVDVLNYIMIAGTKLSRLIKKRKRESPKFGEQLLDARNFINSSFKENNYSQLTGEVFVRSDKDRFTENSFGGRGHRINTVIGLGPSAFGIINGTVYQNIASIHSYRQTVGQGLLPVNTAKVLDYRLALRRAQILSLLQLELPDFLIINRKIDKLVQKWKSLDLLERTANGYKLNELGTLWYNHLQLELVPKYELANMLRMFGSIRSLRNLYSKPQEGIRNYELEMLKFFGLNQHINGLQAMLMKTYFSFRSLSIFDQRAMGFFGPLNPKKHR